MIDTVILSIPKHLVKNKLGESMLGWEQQSSNLEGARKKWIRNPTKQELETGNSYPRLTGYKRFQDYFIRIEFSCPKLLYKNNLDELVDGDFKQMVITLQKRLQEMEAYIDLEVLENAKVSAVHYSKNVLLQSGYTTRYVISELSKANKRKSFDNTTFRFENDGLSLQVYSKAHSFVIYDKIADINKTEKRAIDRDRTEYQATLFDELNQKQEIIRFEVRLSEYKKMVSVFKNYGIKKSFVFKDLFSSEISQNIVFGYWQTLLKNSMSCYLPITTPKELLNLVILSYPKQKSLKQIQLVGLLLLASDGNGLPELRAILSKNQDKRSWYKLMETVKDSSEKIQQIKPREWIYQIESDLKTYAPLLLKNINK